MQEIEKLLMKYFEGETSLPEEKILRDFFSGGDVPEKWMNLKVYFSIIREEKKVLLENPRLENRLETIPEAEKIAPLIDLRRPWIYWLTGVAASILILIAIFVRFDPFPKKIEDTYKDPQVAYMEARKILQFVSSKFNQGTRSLKSVNAIETGLTQLKPVGSYDKAVSEVNRLSDVEKVEKLIINN